MNSTIHTPATGQAFPLPAKLFDAMTVIDNKLYIFQGNQCICFPKADTIDFGSLPAPESAYPTTISELFGGKIPTHFHFDLESISAISQPSGPKVYAQRGGTYVRANISNTSPPWSSLEDPKNTSQAWAANVSSVDEIFKRSWDATITLPTTNNKKQLYITKGTRYLHFPNAASNHIDDQGDIQTKWLNLPTSFQSGFDAMAELGSALVVIKGNEALLFDTFPGQGPNPPTNIASFVRTSRFRVDCIGGAVPNGVGPGTFVLVHRYTIGAGLHCFATEIEGNAAWGPKFTYAYTVAGTYLQTLSESLDWIRFKLTTNQGTDQLECSIQKHETCSDCQGNCPTPEPGYFVAQDTGNDWFPTQP